MAGINAANMYGLFTNIYNNQVAFNDITGLDMWYSNGMMYDPMMSMNGSVFGGGMINPMMVGYPAMMPGFTGSGNYQNYYENYEKYQDFMLDNQVRRQQKMRNADLRLNSPQEGIAKKAACLHEKIMRNEQQQIQQAYQAFKESVRSMYGNGASDEEIANRAATLYKQITGVSVTDDIRQYGRGSFTQGFMQAITLGLADRKTAEENVSEITGQPIGRQERLMKIAGNAAGGAVMGTGSALALTGLWTAKGPVAKFLCKIPVLAAIGGLVAGVIAFAKN